MLRIHPGFATSVALLLGAVLRLSCGWDIEFKSDEQYTTNSALGVGNLVPWPPLGMTSSVGLRNPGMSVWVFSILARIIDARGPVDLARGVQVANIIALLVMLWFSLSMVPEQERELWLWAAALAALCPAEILYDRKIWAQSVLPVVCMLNWIAWWHRRRWLGALLWGVIGATLGQIHLGGFLFAFALTLWTAMFARGAEMRVRWGPWFIGSILGFVPLVPWLRYVWAVHQNGQLGGGGFGQSASFQVATMLSTLLQFGIFWVGFPFGLNLIFSLGRKHFIDFLGHPLFLGRPTYGVLVLYLLSGFVAARILYDTLRIMWAQKGQWKMMFIGVHSESALMLGAALYGYGLLLAFSSFRLPPHYLIVVFPMQYVGLCRLVLGGGTDSIGRDTGRVLLLTLCIVEFLTAVLFLYYIHVNGGAPGGDYGLSYKVRYAAQ
jgi:hypothetical protein